MADQLVQNVDLVTWLDVPTLTFPTDRATELLEVVTGWVQDYTHQKLIPVTGDVAQIENDPYLKVIDLPQLPVTAVSKVTVDDVDYTAAGTDWTLYKNTLRTGYWSSYGQSVQYGRWTYWPQFVTVTYDHGYATCPQGIRGAILSVASRLVANPAGFQSEDVGGVRFAIGSGGLERWLSEDDRAALASYRPLVVG